MKIISASRRTDIPAFYGDWLINRISEGFAGYINPFNNKKNIVSLREEDVAAIVLWSKNFTPFLDQAAILKKMGFTLFFNYTITGLPSIFEPQAPDFEEAVDSLKKLNAIFSQNHINWRYDPVLISDLTDIFYHTARFETLCRSLSGYVKRCYISYPTPYGKVERTFSDFRNKTGISIHSPDIDKRLKLADNLSLIGGKYGIELFSCCGDYLTGSKISKGRCIDGNILSLISGKDFSKFKVRPSRKECGCTESTDIGLYDSCPHGCIYCYANSNPARAESRFNRYKTEPSDSGSAFLGFPKTISDLWVDELRAKGEYFNKDNFIQTEMF